MRYIADFHIHSKYSLSTSPQSTLENINHWAFIKGLNLVNAPDFTHPLWLSDMKEKLEAHKNGLYQLKENYGQSVWFLPVSEVSCIYHQNKRLRKVHLLIFMPDWTAVDEFNHRVGLRGAKLASNGRPVLKQSAKEILQTVKDISPDTLVVPAHAWTPWFSVFGACSGFDSLEECFEESAPDIRAIETGLSSDPAMNRRLSALDDITLISNSDAHSPRLVGREANIFEIPQDEISYREIIRIIREKDRNKFMATLEFFPQEGKYYYDGHRQCGIKLPPHETRRQRGLCPKCHKLLTAGVLNRIDSLADRHPAYDDIPYKNIVGLDKIVAESLGFKNAGCKKVLDEYYKLIRQGGNEFHILLDSNLDELRRVTNPKIIEGIRRLREGNLLIEPGYDGVYGKVKLFD
ncbi:MAG: DNA helicase UvrD [Candidatus Schekmanbacteria bacterium]|nr:DNA helicase UvrD [Candidatus Schekmanbacteria bacterium]